MWFHRRSPDGTPHPHDSFQHRGGPATWRLPHLPRPAAPGRGRLRALGGGARRVGGAASDQRSPTARTTSFGLFGSLRPACQLSDSTTGPAAGAIPENQPYNSGAPFLQTFRFERDRAVVSPPSP